MQRTRWPNTQANRRSQGEDAKKRGPAKTPNRPSRSMIQAMTRKDTVKASNPKQAAHTHCRKKATGGHDRKARLQIEGHRAKNRRTNETRGSGAQRQIQHLPSMIQATAWGGNHGRDGEQTSMRLPKRENSTKRRSQGKGMPSRQSTRKRRPAQAPRASETQT